MSLNHESTTRRSDRPSGPAQIQVLFVDDDTRYADLAARSLEHESETLRVVTEHSATDGLDRLEEGDIDCVVSDYQMPVKDGIEFLRTVRDTRPNLPFILYTGKGDETVASEAISHGVTDYIRKETGADHFALLAKRIRNAVDRHRTEDRYREERSLLESLVDGLPEIFYAYDADGNFIRWNDRLLEVTGYTDAEIEAMDPLDFVTDDDAELIADARDTLLQGGQPDVAEATLVTKDGSEIPYEFLGGPLRDSAGAVRGVVGIGRDISDRVQRERDLERMKNRLELAVESSDLRVWELDPASNTIDIIAGQATDESWLGLDAVGFETLEAFLEHVHEDDRAQVRETVQAMMGGEEQLSDTFRVHHSQTNEILWLELFGERQGDSDQSTIIGMARNVTERERRKRELQRQNEQLEEFASVVSHDLRNPLNVAAGRLELARETGEESNFEVASQALDRMGELIDDLLALAREGDPIDRKDSVDLAALLERCWRTVQTEDATLTIETEATISADAGRAQQLFENLLQNAVQHGGTDVTITVGPLDGGFYVADDGPGIAPDDRSKVFDAGYSTTEEGTGLGLRIVERIASAHGWNVGVTESADGGTRFEITGVEFAQ